MNRNDEIVSRLKRDYGFKQVGEWLREGVCPDCNKKSLYTHAHKPRVVKCGRLNKCGLEVHVKELFEDLFKDWSKTYQRTPKNPNAAADAYLAEGRGLDISRIKGSYAQEQYFDSKQNIGTATVRFGLPNGGWWERFIDQADRFHAKANIKYGYSVKGYWWWHPANPILPKEIWIAEGIFDACALAEHGLATASPISCTNFPEISLQELKRLYDSHRHTLPTLVWAYDNDSAGQRETKKAIEAARKLGFTSVAAQPPHDKHRKLDWNDLHELKQLTAEHLKTYRYYGDLLTAASATDAAVIRYMHTKLTQFYFEHANRTYWFELDVKQLGELIGVKRHEVSEMLEEAMDADVEQQMPDFVRRSSTTHEILNAKLEALYFQRNDITDESWYFTRITTPKGEKQTTITGDQLSSPSKLKPRLLSVFAGVLWTGSAMQLDLIAKHQMEGLKEVKTTDFIGYAKEHNAYIFNDVAFSQGKVAHKNAQDYFKIGRLEIKSLVSDPVLSINTKDAPDFRWWQDFHHVRGDYGTIVLAWWLGSYFAEQIRGIDRSYPFFELVGQAGAGKSRLLEFMWKLSGREDYEGFDPTKSTNVAVYRNFAQVANMPIALIEGDRNDDEGKSRFAKTFEWDSLKDAYNGRPIRSRGVKNNGNDTYSPPFRAAIMISQNEEITASEAMLTRIIHVKLTRDGQTLQTKQIVDNLDRLPLEFTSRFIAHALKQEAAILATYRERVRFHEHAYHNDGVTHTRIALNHAQVAALIDCLQTHILGSLMTKEQAWSAQNTLLGMAHARVTRLQADHPEVERFWSVFEYLNTIREFTNHRRVDDDTIAINLNQFYKAAKVNYQDLPDMTVMKRLLKQSSRYKFIDSNVSVRSNHEGSPTFKCWIFKKPTD